MSLETAPTKKKLPIARLAIAAVILAAVALIAVRAIGTERLLQCFDQGVQLLRTLGPLGYFAAMTVLPALGVPMLAFTIPAGEAFTPTLGLGGVIAASLAAIALNLALAYWLARYALRPVLTRLLQRYGYRVPVVTRENALGILLVVRLTPGPPYAFQCFLLGVAETPFRLYLLVSWLAILPYAVAAIVLGQGLRNGNFGAIFAGVGVVVVAIVGVQWWRRRNARGEA